MGISEVKKIFDRISSVSAKTSKEVIIKQNKDNELFIECLKFLLDSDVVTGLSTKKMNKKVKLVSNKLESLTDAFEYVKRHNTGTDVDIAIIKSFCAAQGECKEFCEQLFIKKLKVGIDAKTVNKCIPGLIPTFDIMLGSKFEFDKVPNETMYITEKLDGIRCFAQVRNGKVVLKSRQNKIFEGLVDIEKAILDLGYDDVCFDGELLSIGSSLEDVYKDTTKKVNNKNKVKTGVKYVLFDIVPIEEFDNKKGKTKYASRRDELDMIQESECLQVAPLLYAGTDMEEIMSILNELRSRGCEGAMCNLNKPYEFKRSKTLLKMKIMQTCDLRVIGFEEGQGRLSGTLGKIICNYKGFELGVGSGFDDTTRQEVWNNQEKYLNAIVEIQYFEETNNDSGGLSLRFPIFKQWRFDKDEESYE